MTIDSGQELPVSAEPAVRPRRLSFAQEQLWFLDQLTPGDVTYNILMVWRLRGALRVDLLRRSLDLVVARHESLRVTIRNDEGTPYQVVAPPAEVPLPVIDLRDVPEAAREQRVQQEVDLRRAQPYDLANGPVCRFHLLQLAVDDYVLLEGFHHAIADGWSVAVINEELSTAYGSLHDGSEPVFEEAELDYTEFAESQRDRLQGEALEEELSFWQEQLAGLPVLELPADRPRPSGGSHRGETLIRDLAPDVRDLVRQLADDHGASMFMVLTAAGSLVLSRYTGLNDIPLGVPMLGRPEPELEAVVGMFINMVVLRSDLSGDPTFSELIERLADLNLDLYEHQEVPFHFVVDRVAPERDPDRNPLFQVGLQLLGGSNSGENLRLPEVTCSVAPLASLGSRFDIAMNLVDDGTVLRAATEYSADLFDGWRIEAMLGHLETVIRAAAANPELKLSQVPIVTDAEVERLRSVRHGDRPACVVDQCGQLAPRGVPGELVVRGEPAPAGQDAAGAIDDPFEPGRPAYRTGDRVRLTEDLRLEFLDQAEATAGLAGDAARAGLAGDAAQAGSAVSESADDGPPSATEQAVTGIIQDVLEVPEVGANDRFFEIGGNSLQAMRVVSRINKKFGIKLSVRQLYGSVTVRTISTTVDEAVSARTA